jgi:hypothetical protein
LTSAIFLRGKGGIYKFLGGSFIAGCQWPKPDHIVEMAGKNKFELSSKKKKAGEIL